MNKTARFFACAAIPFSAALAQAQSPADKQLAADVDALVQKIVSLGGLPGLAIAVVKGDAPVLVKGYGFADIERNIPVTENTAFYIASTTKAFTALTLTLMAEKNVVDLDAPITRYLKDAQWGKGVHADSITLRQLLSHTHGIANNGPVVWRTAFTGVHTNPLLKELLQYHGASDKAALTATPTSATTSPASSSMT